ncbi:MAG: ribbon-helix-helix domain-containing protein [Bifidobacteriaceae bacterium]|nr:ribbon-helix-helix domain-containing protein [Bifidobacteriaceae bacterium]
MSETHGYTPDGREIDDALVARLAAEMEAGVDPAKLVRRPPGRPRAIGDTPGVTVPVRLDEFRLAKLDELAAAEGKTRSQVMREALDGRIAAV